MPISLIYSPEFLHHDTGPYHPENPGRLKSIIHALDLMPWDVDWRSPTPLEQRDPLPLVTQIHDRDYGERVKALSERGGGSLDADTVVSSASYEVALLAVNAWCDGVDLVVDHQRSAFALTRPPGHHATPRTGMGFCLFNNAALAAVYALSKPGMERVAILDWDVHHGNGTEAIVSAYPQLAYCSLHQYPHYPGTGPASYHGDHHNVLNIPLGAGSVFQDYQWAFEQQILPFLEKIAPQLLIISAGYDATQADHLAGINLQPQDYEQFTRWCLNLFPNLLFGLEGGYDYGALSDAVVYTLKPFFSP